MTKLHLVNLDAELTSLTKKQVEYIGVNKNGLFTKNKDLDTSYYLAPLL